MFIFKMNVKETGESTKKTLVQMLSKKNVLIACGLGAGVGLICILFINNFIY